MPEHSNRPPGFQRLAARLVVLGLLGAAALALAGAALGAVNPHLVVASVDKARGQTLEITASKQMADDPVARVQLYVPNGFSLNSPAVGLHVGLASARVVMRDVNASAAVTYAGTVTAISPSDSSISYEGSNCDPNQHLAAWNVQLAGGKSSLSFPIFVDATSGQAASFGPYVLVVCFRPADLAAGDPDRSVNGDVVDSFSLALAPFFRPPMSGAYRWRSIWTPFQAGTGTLNLAGAVEAQSIVNIPTGQIVIFGKKSTMSIHGKRVEVATISGQVLVGGEPRGPGLVTIRHGAVPTKLVSLGGDRTGTNGGYTKLVILTGKREYFQASTNLAAMDLGASACQASFANIPCLDVTSGAGRTVSGTMLVVKK